MIFKKIVPKTFSMMTIIRRQGMVRTQEGGLHKWRKYVDITILLREIGNLDG